MNIYEFCEKFRIPRQKARKMYEAGVLILDMGESPHGAIIRSRLGKAQSLTVPQFLAMIEDPSILAELGHYREKAERQLAALGNLADGASPREVAAYISDAARGDTEAIGILVAWLKQIIPAEPVTHHWVAVRLLLGVPANIRKFDLPRINDALAWCRKSQDFRGWWRIEKRRLKTFTLYQRPEILFDL